MFENNKANNCMRESLKAIHNCWWQYSDTVDKIKNGRLLNYKKSTIITQRKRICAEFCLLI